MKYSTCMGIKGNFSISDEREYVATSTIQKGQNIEQLIFSNAKQIVEQNQYLFETLLDKAISAEYKIKEIEQRVKPEMIRTIKNTINIQNLYQNLIKSYTTEVMLMVPTTNAVYRQSNIGILELKRSCSSIRRLQQQRCICKNPGPNNQYIIFYFFLTLYPSPLSILNIETTSQPNLLS